MSLNLLKKLEKPTPQMDADLRLGRILLTLFGICCVMSCVGTMSLMDMEIVFPVTAIFLGWLFAFPVASTIFFTLVNFEWPIRLIGNCVCLAGYLAVFQFGIFIAGNNFQEAMDVLLPTLPLIAIGISFPFLFFRHVLGWQIVFPSLNVYPVRQSLTVLGMMTFTAVVAFAVTLLRIAEYQAFGWWATIFFAGIGFALLVPMIIKVMCAEDWRLPCVIASIASGFVGVVVLLIVSRVASVAESLSVFLTFSNFFGLCCLAFAACRLLGGNLVNFSTQIKSQKAADSTDQTSHPFV